jgi:hypothetical protein
MEEEGSHDGGGCSGSMACAASSSKEWICTLAGTVVAAGVTALTAGVTGILAGGAFTAGCILGESNNRTYVSGVPESSSSGCFDIWTISKRTHLRDHRSEECYV